MRRADGKKLADKLNVIFFDLLKIHKLLGTPPEKLTKLEKWGLFLSYASDERRKGYIESIIKNEEGLMHAKSSLLTVSQDEINWAIENSIHKAICDYNTERMNILERERRAVEKGIQKGIQKGAQATAISNAKNLLRMNLGTPEQISQAVSLSLEEVLELKKELEQ